MNVLFVLYIFLLGQNIKASALRYIYFFNIKLNDKWLKVKENISHYLQTIFNLCD